MRSFSDFSTSCTPQQIRDAEILRLRSLATWAYLLLRPGMEFVRQRSNFILGWQAAAASGSNVAEGVSAGAVGEAGVPPLGSWMNLPALTSPATRTVLPSNDALYGAAHIELGIQGPMVLHVPANIDHRYFSVSVMDAHLNNVAHIGPHWTGNEAGDFLLVPPGWNGEVPDGLKVIVAPTDSVCLYNRMLVEYVDDDLDKVRHWQGGLTITQLNQWGASEPRLDAIDVAPFVHPDLNTTTDAVEYLRLGLDHLERNPVVIEGSWLSSLIGNAAFVEAASDPDFARAIDDGVNDATVMLDVTLATWPRRNGWMIPNPALGLPNPYILISAAFQQFQIGSNDIDEAAYFFVETDSEGGRLAGAHDAAYQLTMTADQLPETHPDGYWSLTMYNSHGFLVENVYDRYATRTSRPGFEIGDNGSVTIVMSGRPPADVPEANWLPMPEGEFKLGLRVYYPTDSVSRAGWVPPAVQRR